MKKILAMLLVIVMLLSAAACAQNQPEQSQPEQTNAPTGTEAPSAETTEAIESGEMIDGLEVTVFKVIDRSNVVVRFNQDRWGYTDVPNYKIVDEAGNEYVPVSCNSAFWDMGGETPNVFMMTFDVSLPVGNYTITVSNITDAITEPFHTYVPCETTLVITEDIPENGAVGGGAAATDIGEIAVDVYQIVDASNIIVHFDIECIGCTDAPNYIVTNEAGEQMEIVSATSAFMELGGAVPNVFKLTFAEPLAAGTYKVVATNMASTTAIDSIYPDAEAEFTI